MAIVVLRMFSWTSTLKLTGGWDRARLFVESQIVGLLEQLVELPQKLTQQSTCRDNRCWNGVELLVNSQSPFGRHHIFCSFAKKMSLNIKWSSSLLWCWWRFETGDCWHPSRLWLCLSKQRMGTPTFQRQCMKLGIWDTWHAWIE